jgi:hypothetical protein
LVVGVGGGGLAAHLARPVGLAVSACDLDGAVIAAARAHFGLAAAEEALGAEQLRVEVGDGVAAVAGAAPESLALLVVDAGGADAGGGPTTRPPPPFTTPAFLESAASCLDPACGLLAINCVSRAGGPVEDLVAKLKVRERRERGERKREESKREGILAQPPGERMRRRDDPHLHAPVHSHSPASPPSWRLTSPTTSTASCWRTRRRAGWPRRPVEMPRPRGWWWRLWRGWAGVAPPPLPTRARAWGGQPWWTWCWRRGCGRECDVSARVDGNENEEAEGGGREGPTQCTHATTKEKGASARVRKPPLRVRHAPPGRASLPWPPA